MKNFYFVTMILALAVVFNACQKDEMLPYETSSEVMSIKTLGADLIGVDQTSNCCISAFPSTLENVYSNSFFNVAVFAYNDDEKTYVTISRTVGVMTARYAQPGLDETQTIGPTLFNELGSFTIEIPHKDDWSCGDEVTFSFYLSGLGGGSNNSFQSGIITYILKDVCEDTCENELIATLDCEDEEKVLTITFTAEEAGEIVIQGGLSAGAKIVSAESNLLVQNFSHPSAGGPSSVTRWEGNVEACEEITITITYTGGNGVDSWSAKRGDLTLGKTEAKSCL